MKFGSKKVLVVIIYLSLLIFQIKTTSIKTAYGLVPAEADLQIQRMNMFPPSLARLGYILEVKKEVQILGKLENNFFTVIDFREYFPSRLPYIISPFFFLGLYFFIRDRNKWKLFYHLFFISVVILTILGPHAKYGPVLLYPFFVFVLILALLKILKRFKK